MALIKCQECGKEISDKATSCPHCGAVTNESLPLGMNKTQVAKDAQGCMKFFLITFATIFIIAIVAALLSAL